MISPQIVIQTDRLLLRTWSEDDAQPYFELNQDSKVFEFLPGPLTMEAVKQFIAAKNQCFVDNGYTLWAVEEKITGELIGFIGLQAPLWKAAFTPCVEIGWRLGSKYWGQGYATEGAKAALQYGFDHLGLKGVVSFTVPEKFEIDSSDGKNRYEA
jgi:RimJ/RimL family protein N-acetyltransferase